jgi:hypothetical protein
MDELTLRYGCNPHQSPARASFPRGRCPSASGTALPATSTSWTAELLAPRPRPEAGDGPPRGRVVQARLPRRSRAGLAHRARERPGAGAVPPEGRRPVSARLRLPPRPRRRPRLVVRRLGRPERRRRRPHGAGDQDRGLRRRDRPRLRARGPRDPHGEEGRQLPGPRDEPRLASGASRATRGRRRRPRAAGQRLGPRRRVPRRDPHGEGRSCPSRPVTTWSLAALTTKYVQSNSIVLAWNGQVLGAGAGQQSRIHCTRLACGKADLWWLRQHPKVLDLRFREGLKRPERDNAIDQFFLERQPPAIEELWLRSFAETPTRLTADEKREWLDGKGGVALASDAFFPFRDSIDRAAESGVGYVVHPGGSVRDEEVTAAADEHGMLLAHAGVRLFPPLIGVGTGRIPSGFGWQARQAPLESAASSCCSEPVARIPRWESSARCPFGRAT